jgi:hypothetical protein
MTTGAVPDMINRQADEIAARLVRGETVWATTSPARRRALLAQFQQLTGVHAAEWVDVAARIKQLAPGSSLGGARPKASVRDRDGHLAFAKFPHKTDDIDVERLHQVVEVYCRQFDSGAPGRRNVLPDESLRWNRFRSVHDCVALYCLATGADSAPKPVLQGSARASPCSFVPLNFVSCH